VLPQKTPINTDIIQIEKVEELFPQEEIQILYLDNGTQKAVQAYETNTLPCSEIINHLNQGESVFISKKRVLTKPKIKLDQPKSSLFLDRI
jgi:hypothetical protein